MAKKGYGDKDKRQAVEVRPKKWAPERDPVDPNADWVEVTIQLTDEQKAELKALGVDTAALRITTFDIKRLGGPMIN